MVMLLWIQILLDTCRPSLLRLAIVLNNVTDLERKTALSSREIDMTKELLTNRRSPLSGSRTQLSNWILCFFVCLLASINFAECMYTWGQPSHDWRQPEDDSSIPEFEPMIQEVTAVVGQPAYLPCKVKNLGDKVVSWIRTQDLHILTSGIHTFTSDSRFRVLHAPESISWTLKIAASRHQDEGLYECQVNTDPKIKFAVSLFIADTEEEEEEEDESSLSQDETLFSKDAAGVPSIATIMGPTEQYVRVGSTVTFTCLVTSPYPNHRLSKSVDWFHGKRLITFQAARGGISQDTERTEVRISSKLTIAGITHNDSGNYSCRPSETREAVVTLIVVEGERSEAMQRDSGALATTVRLRIHILMAAAVTLIASHNIGT